MISAILLAAGQSKRMDGENKLLKKYKKKHFINHILNTLTKSKISKIIVVLGFQRSKVRKVLLKNKKIKCIYNKKYKSGMASSIKAGLKKISQKNTGFLIIHADMPLVSTGIINLFCLGLNKSNKEIFVPINKKKIGNPIGFKSSMIKFLNKIKGDKGAKKIIGRNKHKLYFIKINSKSIFRDFNTQRDFLIK